MRLMRCKNRLPAWLQLKHAMSYEEDTDGGWQRRGTQRTRVSICLAAPTRNLNYCNNNDNNITTEQQGATDYYYYFQEKKKKKRSPMGIC